MTETTLVMSETRIAVSRYKGISSGVHSLFVSFYVPSLFSPYQLDYTCVKWPVASYILYHVKIRIASITVSHMNRF